VFAMVLLLSLVTVGGVFSFGGGTPGEFCAAVEATTGRPSALLIATDAKLSRHRAEFRSLGDVAASITSAYSFERTGPATFGFGYKDWPQYLILRAESDELSLLNRFPVLDPRNVQIDDEAISVNTGPAGAVTVRLSEQLKLSRPVKSHWLYEDALLALVAKKDDEVSVMAAVASALGADLVLGHSYEFRFNPVTFRKRAIRRMQYQALAASDDFVRRRYELVEATLRALTDRQIVELYSDPTNFLQLDIDPRSEMGKAAAAKVQAFIDRGKGGGHESVAQAAQYVQAHADFTKPMTLRIDASCRALVRVPEKEPNKFINI
jgi:hypothetical protein